jgi:hypothetical protein
MTRSARSKSVRLTALVLGLAALLCGGAPRIARAADARLDQAIENLLKAQAFLEASDTGGSPKVQRKFDRHVQRAINLILRAIDQVETAKEVSDEASQP